MAVDPKATIETHIIITEAADKTLDVRYTSVLAGTETKAHLRPTHLAGLLQTAAFFVMAHELPELKAELSPVKEEEEKKPKNR